MGDEYTYFNKVTLIYLHTTSETYRKNLKNMGTNISTKEATVIKSYLTDLYDEGIEKGMEKGMERLLSAFMRSNPTLGDAEVSKMLDAPLNLVKKVRKKLMASPK
jgi:hypothetical protein